MSHKKRLQLSGLALCGLLGISTQVVAAAQPTLSEIPGQKVATLLTTELRSDKLASAQVLQKLSAGTGLRLISVEGGWALVEVSGPPGKSGVKTSGWVRAGAINWQASGSTAANLSSGRQASGNTALTLGIRSLTPRVNRHALIIGISRYGDPTIPPLPGARIDKQSATQMAQAMQVSADNIRYLQDEQATGDNIRKALAELTEQVQDGDRVFIHYSGHGTRFNDPAAGGCVEALLAYEGGSSSVITNHEMADLLRTITNKTDKLFVMYDACHSGGVVNAASSVRTRGFSNVNDDGLLRPKFANISDECGRPVNVKSRNLVVETTAKGALPQDVIHVSASRDNEVSFDDELKGGLATQFMRDCMLRDAKDLDNSGAISMDEIRQCAQEKIDKRMANDVSYKPHHLMLSGNAAFVPAWFSQANTVNIAIPPVVTPQPVATPSAAIAQMPPTTLPISAPPAPSVSIPVVAVTSPPVQTQLTGEQALRQMLDQRDAKRRVQVTLRKEKLKIGEDAFDFEVQADRAGYVYVAMAGSDNKSVYMLFPNDLDKNNKIEAGQKLLLPRPNWRVKAAGPVGTDHLLVMVTDAPRDLTGLANNKAGPFVASLNDAHGRAQLGALLTTSNLVTSQACANARSRAKNPLCSDAYGAAVVAVEELK